MKFLCSQNPACHRHEPFMKPVVFVALAQESALVIDVFRHGLTQFSWNPPSKPPPNWSPCQKQPDCSHLVWLNCNVSLSSHLRMTFISHLLSSLFQAHPLVFPHGSWSFPKQLSSM